MGPRGSGAWFAIWVGLLISFSVSGYYSMVEAETKYERFAALAGWLFVAGCFVAVNAAPIKRSRGQTHIDAVSADLWRNLCQSGGDLGSWKPCI
jgi:hypothetical protein